MQWACVILSSVVRPALQNVSILSHKRHYFRKKVTEHKMYVSSFSTLSSETFFTMGRIERDMIENVCWSIWLVHCIIARF
jgi:hypothetical protein